MRGFLKSQSQDSGTGGAAAECGGRTAHAAGETWWEGKFFFFFFEFSFFNLWYFHAMSQIIWSPGTRNGGRRHWCSDWWRSLMTEMRLWRVLMRTDWGLFVFIEFLIWHQSQTNIKCLVHFREVEEDQQLNKMMQNLGTYVIFLNSPSSLMF